MFLFYVFKSFLEYQHLVGLKHSYFIDVKNLCKKPSEENRYKSSYKVISKYKHVKAHTQKANVPVLQSVITRLASSSILICLIRVIPSTLSSSH